MKYFVFNFFSTPTPDYSRMIVEESTKVTGNRKEFNKRKK